MTPETDAGLIFRERRNCGFKTTGKKARHWFKGWRKELAVVGISLLTY